MSRNFTGIVISAKMDKTVVVSIEKKLRHPFYRKVITRHKKLKAHNDMEGIKEGDLVKIKEVRPISKNKNFTVIEKIK